MGEDDLDSRSSVLVIPGGPAEEKQKKDLAAFDKVLADRERGVKNSHFIGDLPPTKPKEEARRAQNTVELERDRLLSTLPEITRPVADAFLRKASDAYEQGWDFAVGLPILHKREARWSISEEDLESDPKKEAAQPPKTRKGLAAFLLKKVVSLLQKPKVADIQPPQMNLVWEFKLDYHADKQKVVLDGARVGIREDIPLTGQYLQHINGLDIQLAFKNGDIDQLDIRTKGFWNNVWGKKQSLDYSGEKVLKKLDAEPVSGFFNSEYNQTANWNNYYQENRIHPIQLRMTLMQEDPKIEAFFDYDWEHNQRFQKPKPPIGAYREAAGMIAIVKSVLTSIPLRKIA